MANIFNYCPDDVTVVIAGLATVDGFATGTFISIDKDVAPYTSVRTPDGMTARLHNNDQTYTIQLTLHIGSSTNELLTKLWLADEITNKAKFPIFIKDHSGTDLFFSTTTWIEGLPTLSKSDHVDTRVWTLRSSQAVVNYGTNGEQSSDVDDLIKAIIGSIPAIEGLL